MVSSSDSHTYIWKSADNDAVGFVQIELNDAGTHAHLLYLGSTENGAAEESPINETLWLAMLDQLLVEAGKLGIQSVIAEAPENGPELPILRHAGFAVYTRQDIWMHRGEAAIHESATQVADVTPEDEWDIELLYAHTVPNMIQLVEPHPPTEGPNKWLLREDTELVAYAHQQKGNEATWLRLLVHPNASTPINDLVAAMLQRKPPTTNRPIFCRLRREQQWLESALQANGFEYWGSQAVMVKHTVHHVKKPVRSIESYLKEERATARSTPIMHKTKRVEPTRLDLPDLKEQHQN